VFLKSTAKIRRTFGFFQIFLKKNAKNLTFAIFRLQRCMNVEWLRVVGVAEWRKWRKNVREGEKRFII